MPPGGTVDMVQDEIAGPIVERLRHEVGLEPTAELTVAPLPGEAGEHHVVAELLLEAQHPIELLLGIAQHFQRGRAERLAHGRGQRQLGKHHASGNIAGSA